MLPGPSCSGSCSLDEATLYCSGPGVESRPVSEHWFLIFVQNHRHLKRVWIPERPCWECRQDGYG